MKYLTLVVPCYNSEEYLNHCLDTLIVGGDDVEIIVVNDGSNDRTLEIAKEYQTQYPSIIKIIDKENGGHGSGINCGIKEAKGLFFKVCDSDDWFDQDSYLKLLKMVNFYLNSDDDTGTAYHEALNEIEKFRQLVKNKYRAYLLEKTLKEMSLELQKKVMDAKKRLIFVETKSYDYTNENRRSK